MHFILFSHLLVLFINGLASGNSLKIDKLMWETRMKVSFFFHFCLFADVVGKQVSKKVSSWLIIHSKIRRWMSVRTLPIHFKWISFLLQPEIEKSLLSLRSEVLTTPGFLATHPSFSDVNMKKRKLIFPNLHRIWESQSQQYEIHYQ